MPNWCYTSYVIDGKRKEVQSLFNKMNCLEQRKRPLVRNDFGTTWLGCLVTKLGADWNEVYCRGSWSELEWDGAILRFNTETAWGPMNEVFKLVKSVYPSLEIYYSAEEDMMGVYITNDTEGKYFTDRYKVDTAHDCEYFSTIEGVCNYVSGIIGKTVDNKEELDSAIKEWNEGADDYDDMIYLNEYEIVNDENV